MIVRDEEKYIAGCLNSVKEIVDEIVVVDTGSKDRTVEIAKGLGAKVFDFVWNDDFSAARNFSLGKATGDWILVLDADETMAEDDLDKIREGINQKENSADAFFLMQRNYSNNPGALGFVALQQKTREAKDFKGFYPSKIIRLFRNKKDFAFQGKVHETVDDSIARSGGSTASLNIPIHHYQEEKGGQSFVEKQLKYLELCREKVKENPNDAKAYLDIGIIYYRFRNDAESAIKSFQKAIELKQDFSEAYYNLGCIYVDKGNTDDAIKNFQASLKINPANINCLNNLGLAQIKKGSHGEAIKTFKTLLKINPRHADSYFNLAHILLNHGSFNEALHAYEKALEYGHPRQKELKEQIVSLKKVLRKGD